MPVRVFKEEERKAIKEQLLSVGFPMLKEYGMIHMSIPKIAKAAQIGTGTFYRFFDSKESYIYELIQYRRSKFMEEYIPEDVKSGKRKLTKAEVRAFIELVVDKEESVYANLDLADSKMLFDKVQSISPNLDREKALSSVFFKMIDKPKKDVNFPLLANLMKVLAITSQAREELHPEGYEETVRRIIDMIMQEVYG